ncbi:MAG: hypothetical protein ACI8T1_001097 [Verrucomicrobiales bacterium]|jgi:hypothetical protein
MPCGSRLLQPLREVGLYEKTQSWDVEDIQAAIREAYLQGIAVESLYGTGNVDPERGRLVTPIPAPRPSMSGSEN